MFTIVYFSTESGNTKRFVEKLGFESIQIPECESLVVDKPYVLVVPTYSGGHSYNAVPRPVIHFLNEERNRNLIKGVVGTGNTNFGKAYCLAGKIIASKCNIPNIAKVELFGTPEDVDFVRQSILDLFNT